MEQLEKLWNATGIANMAGDQFVMILVGLVLLFRSLWIRHSGLVFQLVTFKVRLFASSLRFVAGRLRPTFCVSFFRESVS